MPILKAIPIELNPEKVIKELGLKRKKGSLADVQELLETAKSFIRPKAVYKVSYLSQKGETLVKISRATFFSRVLRRNLEKVEKVFPYIITIGKALEDRANSALGSAVLQEKHHTMKISRKSMD